MKRLSGLLFGITILSINLFSQENQPAGKPTAELFTDYHYLLNSESGNSGFNVKRAYFGYNYSYDSKFSGSMIVDIGTPEDLAAGSKPRRYAHFREASVTYADDKLNLTLGITGTKIFAFQQKFWGKRYLALPYQSIFGYGTVADLGFAATYKISKAIEADFTVMNGEGYSNIQTDDKVKVSGGITLLPSASSAIRLYADHINYGSISQTTFVGFAGIKTKVFNIGGEVSYKSNLDLTDGHHAWGISATGGFYLNEKTELFGRYDYSTSVIAAGGTTAWNYTKDGSFVITGMQYTFNSSVKVALNYQGFFPEDMSKSISDGIYLSAHFKF